MPLSASLVDAYNEQINLELTSAYAYLGMATWCDAREFTGCARWLRAQADEENAHALRFLRFLLDRDVEPTLSDIRATRATYDSVLRVFEAALEHEQTVTAAIGRLYGLATDESDYASLPLLNWFTREQVEEEATVRQIVAELQRVGDDSAALTMLDREIGQRRGDRGGGETA